MIEDGRVNSAAIKLEGIELTDEPIQKMTLIIANGDGTSPESYDMVLNPDLSYTGTFDTSRFET